MIEEKENIVITDNKLKFHEYLQELYNILQGEVVAKYRLTKAKKILSAMEEIPIPDYCWTGKVSENLIFAIIDRLCYFSLNKHSLME